MADQFSSLTRRQFNTMLAAAAVTSGVAADGGEAGPWSAPAIVKKVYIGVANPTWPRPDLDLKNEIAGIDARLAELERKHPGQVRFTGGEWLKETPEVEAWSKDVNGVDAVLVLDLTSSTAPLLRPLDKLDVPKLLFTRPITGWSFMDGARWIQMGLKGGMVASSRFEDLAPYLPLLRAIHHLRHSKVLVITPDRSGRLPPRPATPRSLARDSASPAIWN